MKEYGIGDIRNLCLVGHGGSGKTSLTEAMLFTAGEITRLGSVDEGNTVSDYNPDEIERKISIALSFLHTDWNGKRMNILDAPGYADFVGEVACGLRVADCALVVVNAQSGIEVGTETVWKMADEENLSRMVVINRLDKEHAKFDPIVQQLQDRFGAAVVPVQLAVNPGEGFDSIVDLVSLKLIKYERDRSGKFVVQDVPADLQAKVSQLREKLVEKAAETDDQLMERYFENGDLSPEELREGLRKGIASRTLIPVLATAATLNIGTAQLLDFIAEFGPSPLERGLEVARRPDSEQTVELHPDPEAPTAALVFKTVSEMHLGELLFFRVYSGSVRSGSELLNPARGVTEKIGQIYEMNGKSRHEIGVVRAGDIGAVVKLRDTHTGDTLCDKKSPVLLRGINFPEPVIRVAVEPKTKGDEEKISAGLAALHEEDPTFTVQYDPELRQTIVSGQGELHLEVVIKRLKDKFGVDVTLAEPKIPYRETLRKKAEAQGKYKKQTGGRGQYGDVWLRLEPLPRGQGFEFVDAIVGGVVPSKYVPAVEKGVREAMAEGVIAGFPVQDVKVTLYDGSFHPVDSSDLAFKIAASMGFKKAFKEADPVILEPIYDVEVVVPEEYLGDVMGDLSARRGKILGIDSEGPFQVIKAKVPLAELYKYSTALRSLTQGRGMHRRRFSHYEEVPKEIAEKLIAKAEEERQKK
ncbi:MAG: elongation factor G [candidate division KSB1 bacterium]|nr:elongation factor G [candidate division KSB1 bacterium]